MTFSPSDAVWIAFSRLGSLGRLDRTARELGLRRIRGRPLVDGSWGGALGEYSVRIRAHRSGPSRLFHQIELSRHEGGSIEGSKTAAAWAKADPDHRLGRGESLSMTGETLRLSSWSSRAGEQLPERLAWLRRTATTLRRRPIEELTLERLRLCPRAEFRETLCRAYLEEFPHSRDAPRVRARGLSDPSWTVRLAARTAGLPPLDTFRGARAFVFMNSVPVPVRIRALAILAEAARHPSVKWPQAVRDLGQFANQRSVGLRAAAASACGVLGTRGLRVLRHLVTDPSEDVRCEVAKSLGLVGGRYAEQLLLTMLQPPPHWPGAREEDRVLEAIIRSIHAAGTPASVPVLSAHIERAMFSPPLNEAALEAIRAIRGRIPHQDSGTLALTDVGHISEANL